MTNDITVQKIVNFLHDERDSLWVRNICRTRIFDGITWLTEGCIEYRFENRTLTANAGDLVFLSGNVPYSGRMLSDCVSFYVVNFESSDSDALNRIGAPLVVTPTDAASVDQAVSSAFQIWTRQSAESALSAKGLVYQLLCRAVHNRKPERHVSGTEQILEYISQHLGDPTLSVKKLCNQFYVSESQLRRNVQKATGLKPNEYVLTLRLQKAESELLNTDKPIKRIAEECGFTSPYYFSRCFSNHTNLSPKGYRKQFDVL